MAADKIRFFPGDPLRWVELPQEGIRATLHNSPWGLPQFRIYGGAGYIAGTVTVAGAAAVRNVYLFDRLTGALVDRTTSAADGSYRFDNLNGDREFFVLATDADADQYNAAVADLIVPAIG